MHFYNTYYLILNILFIYLLKTQTALHWAAKHGRADIVKLLAGTHGIDVNGKTVSNSYLLSVLYRQDLNTDGILSSFACYFRSVNSTNTDSMTLQEPSDAVDCSNRKISV